MHRAPPSRVKISGKPDLWLDGVEGGGGGYSLENQSS